MGRNDASPGNGEPPTIHNKLLIRGWLQFLSWGGAAKSLAIASLCFASSLVYWYLAGAFSRSESYWQWLDPVFLETWRRYLHVVIGAWGGVTVLAWLVWRTGRNPVWLPHVVIQLYVFCNSMLSYGLGPVTNPIVAVGLVGGAVATYLIFDWRVAAAGAATAIALLVVATVATMTKVLPYAPLFGPALTVGEPSREWTLLFGGVALTLAVVLLALTGYMTARIQAYERELETLSATDALSGLANRRALLARLDEEVGRINRYGGQLGLVILDLDNFKTINDTYGHHVGDAVIRELGRALRQHVRRPDVAGRYGGDEFAIVLPETDAAGALAMAERCRATIEAIDVALGDGQSVRVTASLGCMAAEGKLLANVDAVIQQADGALYTAKRNGRNRASVAA